MRLWYAIKPLFWMLLGVLGAVLVTGALVAAGLSKMVVPSPKNTAESFMRALAAHRYEGALELLAEAAAARVNKDELQVLVGRYESTQQRIDQVHGTGQEVSGDSATVELEIIFTNGNRRSLVIPLRRENGVWRVDSVEPIWNLIHIAPRGKISTI